MYRPSTSTTVPRSRAARPWRSLRPVVIAVAAIAALWCAAEASAADATSARIYWANETAGRLGDSNLEGKEADESFLAGGGSRVQGTMIAGGYIFWGNDEGAAIGRANLEGKEANTEFIKSAGAPDAMVVFGSHIYWTSCVSGSIGRANLEGKEVQLDFIPVTSGYCPNGLAIVAGHIYWADANRDTISRANLEGKEVDEAFISPAGSVEGMTADAGHIYWSNYTKRAIGRANLEGHDVEQEWIKGADGPTGITVTPQHLYWTNIENGTIARANLEGTEVDEAFITGASRPYGVAVLPAAPTVTISAGPAGATYAEGASVPTSFSCAEGTDGPGLASCSDSNGISTTSGGSGHLTTSTPGSYTYSVTATSSDGQSAAAQIAYTVQAPTAPILKRAPVVNAKTGAITLEYTFAEPGEAVERGEVKQGATLARLSSPLLAGLPDPLWELQAGAAKLKACRKGYVRTGGKCVNNAPVAYGQATLKVAAAATDKIVIEPSAKVRAALRKGKKLAVELTLVFTPANTTDHISQQTSATVRLKRASRRHRR